MEILNNLSHKAYRLPLLAGILFLAALKLAFSPTWDAWREHDALSKKAALVTDISYQPGFQQRKDRELDKLLERYRVDSAGHRSRSMNVISMVADKENVRIVEIPLGLGNEKTDSAAYRVQTVTFEGDFAALTRVYHELHSRAGIGVIRSGVYRMSRNAYTNDVGDRLRLTLYMEWLNNTKL